MRFSRPVKKPLLMILVNRSVLFILLLSVFSLFLYALGTRQLFTERTQLVLLRVASVLSVLLFAGAFYGIILNIYYILRKIRKGRKRPIVKGERVYLFLGIFGLLIAALTLLVLGVASGTPGEARETRPITLVRTGEDLKG